MFPETKAQITTWRAMKAQGWRGLSVVNAANEYVSGAAFYNGTKVILNLVVGAIAAPAPQDVYAWDQD